jgi:hypothetical protein
MSNMATAAMIVSELRKVIELQRLHFARRVMLVCSQPFELSLFGIDARARLLC